MAKRNNSKVRVKRRSKASMTRNTRRNTRRNIRRNTRRRNSIKRTKRKSNRNLRNRNKNLYHGGMLSSTARGMRSGWDQLPNLGVGETLFGQGTDYVDPERVLALSSGSNSISGSQPTAGYYALQGQCLPQDNYIPNVGTPIQRQTPPPPILRPRRMSVKNTAPDPLPRPRSRSRSRPRSRSQSRQRRMSLPLQEQDIGVMNPLAMN